MGKMPDTIYQIYCTMNVLSLAIFILLVVVNTAQETHILACSGSSRSSCVDKKCQVMCSDGNKVELVCKHGSVAIKSKRGNLEVSCGVPVDPATFPTIQFPPCFPFCPEYLQNLPQSPQQRTGQGQQNQFVQQLLQSQFPLNRQQQEGIRRYAATNIFAPCFPFCFD